MEKRNDLPAAGIDDLSIYVPSLYLDIEDLANARNVEPAKLKRGLGLDKMAVPDASEDVITMASEAIIDLVNKNNLQPEDIGRIYVGTESMVDGSKPIASYLVGILRKYFDQRNIDSSPLTHCDVVDMVFACIGAVDAMHNSLDYIRINPKHKVIIVSTDWAKYDLNSPGESTQGAGAFAILLSAQPKLLKIDTTWGVATQCEHDFYKPLRRMVRFDDLVVSNGIDASKLGREVYSVHKDTPVYDGQFSNECYTSRIAEALDHFHLKSDNNQYPLERWNKLVFHLPYAYHARRVFTTLFVDYLKYTGRWESFLNDHPDLKELESTKMMLRAIAKTPVYKSFVQNKIEPGERASSLVGNLYTGSIFLSLISCLASLAPEELANQKIGFFAYGSGSKSKVFEGELVPGYSKFIQRIKLFDRLEDRIRINIDQYEYLHKEKLLINLDSVNRKVLQDSSGWMETNKYARNYSVKI